jgi:hypothetical protein
MAALAMQRRLEIAAIRAFNKLRVTPAKAGVHHRQTKFRRLVMD